MKKADSAHCRPEPDGLNSLRAKNRLYLPGLAAVVCKFLNFLSNNYI